MTIFISGGAKNGKSTLAQDLTVALSKGGKHYYVATMISSGAEDDARIRKHIADREGMGFETVECFRNIMDCLQTADSGSVCLVDSVGCVSWTLPFTTMRACPTPISAGYGAQPERMGCSKCRKRKLLSSLA